MNMKKTVALSLATALIAGSAYAMGPGNCERPSMGPPQIERLQDRLDLSEAQVDQLRTLFEKQQMHRRALRKEHRAKREQMQQDLSEILTSSQLEDFKAMRGNERRGRGFGQKHDYRHGPNWW